MKRWDVFRILNQALDEQLAVCHFGPARAEWFDVSGGRQTFFLQGGMGMASCIGLGLALTLPHRKVWVFEGDGALALNLNCLLTIAAHQPPNLLCFVMSNGIYEAVGGQPIASAGRTDFAEIGRSVGVEQVRKFENAEDLEDRIPSILERDQFGLVELVLEPELGAARKMPWDPKESKYRFCRYLEETENTELLPP